MTINFSAQASSNSLQVRDWSCQACKGARMHHTCLPAVALPQQTLAVCLLCPGHDRGAPGEAHQGRVCPRRRQEARGLHRRPQHARQEQVRLHPAAGAAEAAGGQRLLVGGRAATSLHEPACVCPAAAMQDAKKRRIPPAS
jgi:hypothetical protein